MVSGLWEKAVHFTYTFLVWSERVIRYGWEGLDSLTIWDVGEQS